jgi:hypothetical protein
VQGTYAVTTRKPPPSEYATAFHLGFAAARSLHAKAIEAQHAARVEEELADEAATPPEERERLRLLGAARLTISPP